MSVSVDMWWFPKANQELFELDEQALVCRLVEIVNLVKSIGDRRVQQEELAEKLITVFGEEILSHPMMTRVCGRMIYTMSRRENEFRAWYGPPWGFRSEGSAESCGENILFSVHTRFYGEACRPNGLREWAKPFIEGLAEFSNPRIGTVWIGAAPYDYV